MSNDDTNDDADGERDGYGDLEVAEPPTYAAPPELVVDEDGFYGAMYVPPDSSSVQYWYGRRWVCNRCDTLNTTDRDTGPGTPEPPVECTGCEREGPFRPDVTDGDHADRQAILDVFPDRSVYDPPLADFAFDEEPTFGSVYGEIRDYIERYWAAGDGREWMYDMLTCYAISTWFRERWYFVPHLLVVGRHETGKTRLLNTLSNVSYRCVHNASLTSAYIYRGINHHNMTMYISEYHRLNDEKQEAVDAIINAGQKRGETIGRAAETGGGDYNVETFDPFSHIAISTQYTPNDDTISRCFKITTKPAHRDVPRRLFDRPELRRKLLYLRFRYLHDDVIETAEQDAVETMNQVGVRDRLSEKLWCILTVGELADADLSHVVDAVIDREDDRQEDTQESIFVQALIDEAFEQIGATVDAEPGDDWEQLLLPVGSIRNRFENMTGTEVSTSYIGQLRNRVGLEKVRHSDGTKIKDPRLKPKLKQLADENNVEWSPSPGIVDDPETVEIRVDDRPKHSLEEENDSTPTQAERKEHVEAVCRMLQSDEPTDVDEAAAMAAEQFEGDESTYRNELELMIGRDHRFEKLDDGARFNFIE